MCSTSFLYITNSIILEIMDEFQGNYWEDDLEDGIYDEVANEEKGQTLED